MPKDQIKRVGLLRPGNQVKRVGLLRPGNQVKRVGLLRPENQVKTVGLLADSERLACSGSVCNKAGYVFVGEPTLIGGRGNEVLQPESFEFRDQIANRDL
jgi:hypothetical protein